MDGTPKQIPPTIKHELFYIWASPIQTMDNIHWISIYLCEFKPSYYTPHSGAYVLYTTLQITESDLPDFRILSFEDNISKQTFEHVHNGPKYCPVQTNISIFRVSHSALQQNIARVLNKFNTACKCNDNKRVRDSPKDGLHRQQ